MEKAKSHLRHVKKLVIDSKHFVSITPETDDYGRHYSNVIIEEKLGVVFKALPYGMINKTETGIGATTLEIKAERNSIIVFPTKSIPFRKFKKYENEGAFYVGSRLDGSKKSTSVDDIKYFLRENVGKTKKILVVADSLPKVIEAIGPSVFSNYFLLIDEIDSFQMGSNFRPKLESCMDYYAKFEAEKRAMTSATIMTFSNPILKNEPVTRIAYASPKEKVIDRLIFTRNLNVKVANVVLKIVNRDPKAKILIAFNAVLESKKISDLLNKAKPESSLDIGFLCSNNSNHFKDSKVLLAGLENDRLENNISFMSCAFFVGIDIDEPFHLVTVSDCRNHVMRLTMNQVLQISGRCRAENGLQSHQMIVAMSDEHSRNYSEKDLLKAAEGQKELYDIHEKLYEQDGYNQESFSKVKENIDKDKETYGLLRFNIKKEIGFSYFNIDQKIELYANDGYYKNKSELKKALSNAGFNVKSDVTCNEDSIASYSFKEKVELCLDAVILGEPNAVMLWDKQEFKLIESAWNVCKDVINESTFKNRVVELCTEESGIKCLRNVLIGLEFHAKKQIGGLQNRIEELFTIGRFVTGEDILGKLQEISETYSFFKDYSSKFGRRKRAVTFAKNFLELKKAKNRERVNGFTVEGYNPLGID